jgi:autonomous glycyl radical cofactor GrcA
MEQPEVRIARTESLFRNVNERMAESAQRTGSEDAAFVCECSDADCTEQVEAPLDVYEDVRADGTQFLLVPGHEDERIEQVVRERRRYSIVRKVNRIVAAHVRRLDPRARTA